MRKRSVNQLTDLDVHAVLSAKTPKSEQTPITQYDFRVLYLLIKTRNKAAMEALLYPAANHNQMVLQNLLRQFAGIDQHFLGLAQLNQWFPLIYVRQILTNEKDNETLSWLNETFLLPVYAIHIPAKSINFETHIVKLAMLQCFDELTALLPQHSNQPKLSDLIMLGILYSGVLVVHEHAWRELAAMFANVPGFKNLITNIAAVIHPAIADSLLPKSSVTKSISILVNQKYLDFNARMHLPESSGMCQGLSVMNSQAYLCEDEAKLTARVNLFFRKTVQQIRQEITEVKQRIRNSSATPADLDMLEAEIYMQNVSLAQKPAQLHGFFANSKLPHLSQNKLNFIIPLIESNKMCERGGLCVAGQSTGVYMQDELMLSLQHVNQFFINHYSQFTGRFALLISSVEHTLSLIYDASNRTYTCLDGAHRYVSAAENCQKLVTLVKKSFSATDCLILYTDVLCAGIHAPIVRAAFQRLSALSPFAEIHSYSAVRAAQVDARGASWLCVVTAHENETFVNYLLNSGANPNLAACTYSPLSIALQMGHAPIIARLTAAGALPNEQLSTAPMF